MLISDQLALLWKGAYVCMYVCMCVCVLCIYLFITSILGSCFDSFDSEPSLRCGKKYHLAPFQTAKKEWHTKKNSIKGEGEK